MKFRRIQEPFRVGGPGMPRSFTNGATGIALAIKPRSDPVDMRIELPVSADLCEPISMKLTPTRSLSRSLAALMVIDAWSCVCPGNRPERLTAYVFAAAIPHAVKSCARCRRRVASRRHCPHSWSSKLPIFGRTNPADYGTDAIRERARIDPSPPSK